MTRMRKKHLGINDMCYINLNARIDSINPQIKEREEHGFLVFI